ncbi:MAG: 4-hydroxy-tetrahydrodipicolinate reductase [Armatimonadota bacterium]|nr:4-hydroxy-tetrahydrodipicolinate reductase [Armatimonadota bacterium]
MNDTTMKVGVVGAFGRMGREVCRTVDAAPDMDLVMAIDREGVGTPVREFTSQHAPDIRIEDRLSETLDKVGEVDAVVDFTHPKVAAHHALVSLKHGVAPIVGTSGLSVSDLAEIRSLADEKGVAAAYVPNFAIGAVLLMRFAMEAAKHMPECEIIEMHHEKKADAPSGTATRTAELIAAARLRRPDRGRTDLVRIDGVRGGSVGETPIHSVRLPGLLAHQMVIFGGQGEVLTLRHDSMDRSSFMSGVLVALRGIRGRKGLIVGLENLLD